VACGGGLGVGRPGRINGRGLVAVHIAVPVQGDVERCVRRPCGAVEGGKDVSLSKLVSTIQSDDRSSSSSSNPDMFVVAVVDDIVVKTAARQVVNHTHGVVQTVPNGAHFLLVVGGGVILPGGGGGRWDFTGLKTVEFVGKERAALAETGGGLHTAS